MVIVDIYSLITMLQHDQKLSQHLKFGGGAKLKKKKTGGTKLKNKNKTFRGKILNLFLGFFFFFWEGPPRPLVAPPLDTTQTRHTT
jgi:hypothetical protein